MGVIAKRSKAVANGGCHAMASPKTVLSNAHVIQACEKMSSSVFNDSGSYGAPGGVAPFAGQRDGVRPRRENVNP